MKSILKVSACAVAAVAMLTACNKEDSSSVDQTKIWIAHTVDYDANLGITTASAQFRFSNGVGTLLKLSPPANVTINGEAAEYVDAVSLYKKTYTGVKDSAVFVYTDTRDSVFTNTVNVGGYIDLPVVLDTVHKALAYNVVFQGVPVVSGEAVNLYIKEGNGTNWQSVTQIFAGSTNVIMTVDKLQNLNTGPGQIKIERVKFNYTPAQDPGKGGFFTSKYSSQVKNIVIAN